MSVLVINPYRHIVAAVTDDFNRANGGLGANWGGGGAALWAIVSNVARKNNASDGMAVFQSAAATSDHEVTVTVVAAGTGTGFPNVMARVATAADTLAGGTFYWFYTRDTTGDSGIGKTVAGAGTVLLNLSGTLVVPSAPFTMTLRVAGAQLTAFINGGQVGTLTDSAITTGLYAGFSYGNSGAANRDIDNFNISNVAGSGTVNAVTTGAWGSLSGTANIPPPSGSRPETYGAVGPRISLTNDASSSLAPGNYSGKNYTSAITLQSSGTYVFTDCVVNFSVLYSSLSRTLSLVYCHIDSFYCEAGGQYGLSADHCLFTGNTQALRPKGYAYDYDTSSTTPMLLQSCILHTSGQPPVAAHVESMQSLGGADHVLNDCWFICDAESEGGHTMITAAINDIVGRTTYTNCGFDKGNAYFFMYCTGPSNRAIGCIVGTFGSAGTWRALASGDIYSDGSYNETNTIVLS